ncbi:MITOCHONDRIAL SUBSTRATE CARRIER FAMILY PROTEIN [Salix koriyanagi]|uniref:MITOCHONDRIAL SUBSTRATE CARRIER FAMILY PROTEIN n=1 Tax=Salix koriyanagi TaxID=2511006 RepID=A0A9Q0SZ58_9ROSI|nr:MITOCHONDRIAL SUBSTRATE CARRIER FAMILY PROTEIN [Salix koriyanagi]
MEQPHFELLKVTKKMLVFEPSSKNYSRSLFWRFLKRGTSSWNESWEGKGLATVGIGYESEKVYGWMKELIPAGSKDPANNSREGCISRDPTGPANNLASRTADCYSDSVKSKEVSLCDNGRVVTIGKSSSLSSDYFLGALQEFNANSSASRALNSGLCADYNINCLAPCKSAYEHLENDIGDFDVPKSAREQPQNLVTQDRTGIQIQSSACEKPQHALAKQEHAFAGAFAGICVSLCLHPIDTVKTIIQSCPAEQKSISCIGRSIVSERGVTGLYRGISSNIASSAPISAIYTFTYESVKGSLLPHFPKEHYSFAHCIAGGCASIATSFVFTPSERVKQQMQIGSHYNNCWSALVGIIGKGGFHSLYAGWGAVLCRNIPQSVIKFYTYESLKQSMLSSQNSSAQPNTLQTVCSSLFVCSLYKCSPVVCNIYAFLWCWLGGWIIAFSFSIFNTFTRIFLDKVQSMQLVCGGLAGSTAALFTTPFDVVKTRLQTQIPGSMSPYGNVFHALEEIGKKEGLKGLYRGLTPRLVMYVSQGALFFASYEFLKRLFSLEMPQFNARGIQHKETIEDDSALLPLAS